MTVRVMPDQCGASGRAKCCGNGMRASFQSAHGAEPLTFFMLSSCALQNYNNENESSIAENSFASEHNWQANLSL